jgi:hypothetical protein
MPIFDIKQEESKEIAKATFDKKEDYKVVYLNSDPAKKPRLLHKLQANRLIASKKATEVKDAKLEPREVETIVSVEPKIK